MKIVKVGREVVGMSNVRLQAAAGLARSAACEVGLCTLFLSGEAFEHLSRAAQLRNTTRTFISWNMLSCLEFRIETKHEILYVCIV